MNKSIKAKVRVKIITDFGYWCLAEIRGLKEGTILEGRYNPINKAFDFSWNGQDAMLWIEQNGELISTEKESIIGNIVVTIAVCYGKHKNIIAEFDTMKEARKYVKDEGYKDSIEYWYLAAEIINEDGDINPAVWAKSKAEAVRKLKKLL